MQAQVKLNIGGEKIKTAKVEPVKSLGRWYVGTLSDRGKDIEVQKLAEGSLKTIVSRRGFQIKIS